LGLRAIAETGDLNAAAPPDTLNHECQLMYASHYHKEMIERDANSTTISKRVNQLTARDAFDGHVSKVVVSLISSSNTCNDPIIRDI
jgi:hypothetical protein